MKAKFLIPHRALCAALFIFTFFISCDKKARKANFDGMDTNLAEVKEPSLQQKIPVGSLQQTMTDSGISPVPLKPAGNPDWDKKIIKTASLRLEVKDFKKYNENLRKTVKQFGGYIAQEEQNLTDERSETIVSIKVPVEQFETMMNQLPGDDVKVMERKITTEDVTGEVVDTRSRLEAKKQMRLKYMEFLKLSKNMEEVLQVQNEINGIQEEIESAAGRVEYLSHQSLYSTINLSFYQPVTGYRPTTDVNPSFFTRTAGAFRTGVSWIADLFVALVSVWPLLLIVFGIYFSWRRTKLSKIPLVNQVK